MLCCYGYNGYDSVAGNCCVCQKSCTTRTCKCMYLHKECSYKLLKFYGKRCGICNKSFKRWFLESCPPDTNEEIVLTKKSKKIQLLKKRIVNLEIKEKINVLAPCILQMYPYLNGENKIDAKLLIDDVCNDICLKKRLYQNLLNCGLKSKESKDLIKFLKSVNEYYEIYYSSTNKLLKKIFIKHLLSPSTWEYCE